MTSFYGYNIGQLPGKDLPKVKGIESARQYPTMPDSRCVVFEDDDDVFYLIETDSSNYKSSIRRFRFTEESIEDANDAKYATKEDFNLLREAINNVQQSIQQLAESNRTNNSKQFNGKQRSNSGGENETRG